MNCLGDGSKLACWVLTAALVASSPVSAQTDSVATWPIGSRVRVWTTLDQKFVGYLREVRGDTLLLVAPGASRVQRKILVDIAVRLEVSRGRTFSAKNIAVGALGGAATAVAIVAILNRGQADCSGGGGCGWDPPYGGIALGGGAVGAIAGVFVLKEYWRPVRIPGRVSLMPSPRQTGIGLSFSFR